MFFPTGPMTTIYGLILLISVIACLWHRAGRSGNVAGAIGISWIVALSATKFDVLSIQVIGTALCALIALAAQNRTGDIVALLFALKLPIYGSHAVGFVRDVEDMWLASEIVAYIQIIIMILGGIADGGYRRLRALDSLAVPTRGLGHLVAMSPARLKRMATSR